MKLPAATITASDSATRPVSPEKLVTTEVPVPSQRASSERRLDTAQATLLKNRLQSNLQRMQDLRTFTNNALAAMKLENSEIMASIFL